MERQIARTATSYRVRDNLNRLIGSLGTEKQEQKAGYFAHAFDPAFHFR